MPYVCSLNHPRALPGENMAVCVPILVYISDTWLNKGMWLRWKYKYSVIISLQFNL